MFQLFDRKWQTPILLFILFFVSAVYFYHLEAGWSVNSRIDLTYAIVEKGTFVIDYYQQFPQLRTSDIAFYNGHYYSDKIIGTSLLGTIPMSVVSVLERWFGLPFSWNAKRYVVETFSIKLLGALSAVILYQILLTFGASIRQAFLLTFFFFFGTQVFSVSMVFLSYAPALFFSLLSYAIILRERKNLNERVLFQAGLCLGAALLCEYVVGLVAIGLTVYVFVYTNRKISIFTWLAGILIPLSLFAFYTIYIFGRPVLPYHYLVSEEFKAGMSQGIEGITAFNATVLYLITFGQFRGLFYHSPFLLLAVAGWIGMWKDSNRRSDAILSATIAVAYLLFNASYYLWWGGHTNGPRHLIPALPFLVFPLVWVWNSSKIGPWLIFVSAIYSIFWNALPAMVNAQLPQGHPSQTLYNPQISFHFIDPLWEFGIKKLPDSIAVNPGLFIGFKTFWSLVPLAIFWLVLFWFLHKSTAAPKAASEIL